jgi:hypothetical protein
VSTDPIKSAFPEAATSDDLKRRVRTLADQTNKGPKTPMKVRILTGIAAAVCLGGLWINRPKPPTSHYHVTLRGVQTAKEVVIKTSVIETRVKMLDHLDMMHPQIVIKMKERTVNIYDVCRNQSGQILFLIGTGQKESDKNPHDADWVISPTLNKQSRWQNLFGRFSNNSPLNGEALTLVCLESKPSPKAFELRVYPRLTQGEKRNRVLQALQNPSLDTPEQKEIVKLVMPLGMERRVNTTFPSDWEKFDSSAPEAHLFDVLSHAN